MKFDQFTIRPLELSDLSCFYQLVDRNRKRLEDFFTGTVSRTSDIVATEIFLTEILEKRNQKIYYPFILEDTTTGNFIGFMDLKNIDWSIPKSEIGCYTDEPFAGKGITTKALSMFLDYCFQEFKFRKLFLRTHESNKAAQLLAEKCGFEKEGTIRMDYKKTSGEIVDLIYYGRINVIAD